MKTNRKNCKNFNNVWPADINIEQSYAGFKIQLQVMPNGDQVMFVVSELFGEVGIGINFNKYEDIPVEATGADCPAHINSV